jgi:hypothetical protein
MLVQVACVINATVQGARTGWILSAPECLGDATAATAHRFRYEIDPACPPAILVYSWVATGCVLCGLVVSIIMYPIIYHGLLSIGVQLSNPLGVDLINFPGSFYQHIMKAEVTGFGTCADAVDLGGKNGPRWWHLAASRA